MIEAPYSKHNRTNFRIYLALCLGAAVIFAYDGYLSKYEWSHRRKFYEQHTRTLLFRTGAELQKDLDSGLIPQELRLTFTGAKVPLSEAAVASAEKAGQSWLITDQAGKYSISKDDEGLAVYKVGPNETMLFNQISPIFFVAAAVLLAVRFWLRRGIKLVADESELVVAGRERIPYDAIDRIDRTYFEKKGFFTVVYKKGNGREAHLKLSDRDYDNLRPILDHLIAKIT
jgi:hypothetical protein